MNACGKAVVGIAALFLPLGPIAAAAQDAPAGQLLSVRGKVQVKRGATPATPASLLFPVLPGDRVFVGPASSAEVMLFRTGRRYVLAARSSVQVAADIVRLSSGPALRPRRMVSLPPPPQQPPRRLMGIIVRGPRESGPAWTLRPDGGVRDGAVMLEWYGSSDGRELLLRIRDASLNVVHSARLPAAERKYPVPDGVLRPGEYYQWSLAASSADGKEGPAATAVLRVLTPAERAALQRIEKAAAEEREKDPNDTSLLLALAQAYEQYRMPTRAREAYEQVLLAYPDDPVVRKALERLPQPLLGDR